jgi:hypothetical protein
MDSDIVARIALDEIKELDLQIANNKLSPRQKESLK